MENARDEILHNSISPLGPNPEVCVKNFLYIRQRKTVVGLQQKFFLFVALTAHYYHNAFHTTTIAHQAMPAGGRNEEGMGGMRERGARAGGGVIVSGGGRGEMRGREKAMGGGREETVSGGCHRGGAGTEGAGVVTG